MKKNKPIQFVSVIQYDSDGGVTKNMLFTGVKAVFNAQTHYCEVITGMKHGKISSEELDECMDEGYFEYNGMYICISEPEVEPTNKRGK